MLKENLKRAEVKTENGCLLQFVPNDENGARNAYLRLAHADDTYIDSISGKDLLKLAKALAKFAESPVAGEVG